MIDSSQICLIKAEMNTSLGLEFEAKILAESDIALGQFCVQIRGRNPHRTVMALGQFYL